MLSAKAEDETIKGVSGVRFTTNARPETEPERQLQEIQSRLSGGVVELPAGTTLPHLNFYEAAVVNGPSQTYISLWVRKGEESQASTLLEAAGFILS